MALMTLLPAGTGIGIGDWGASSGTFHAALQTNNGDTSYVHSGNDGSTIYIDEFQTPSDVGVASGDVASVTSVYITTYGRYPARGSGGTDVDFKYKVGSDVSSAQTLNYNNSNSHHNRFTSAVTTQPNGGVWNYTALGNVEVQLIKNGAASPDVRITYLALVVSYVTSGWSQEKINGISVSNVQKINGIEIANIEKVNGV